MDHNHPIAGIGAIVIHNNQVLLVKRAKPPKQGLWCIPGGKIRFGETLQQAAEREIYEETGVTIKAGMPYYIFDLIETGNFHYIIVDLLAEYIRGEPNAGDDAMDAKWFGFENINDPGIDSETKKLLNQLMQQRQNFPEHQSKNAGLISRILPAN
ncbi:NUDIX hydrolase [Kaarinaea lacus]